MYPECDTIEKIDRHLKYWHKLMAMSLEDVVRFVSFTLKVYTY